MDPSVFPSGFGMYNDGRGMMPGADMCFPSNMRVEKADEEEYTTVMLRNIPNKYTRMMLLEQLHKSGFQGHIDYLYLPTDFANRCNVGYCFVNFRSSSARQSFCSHFDGIATQNCLPGFNSYKVCQVVRAKWQGREENVRRLRSGPELMAQLAAHPEWLPLLLDEKGEPEPFLCEEDLAAIRSPTIPRRQMRRKGGGKTQESFGDQSVPEFGKGKGKAKLPGRGKAGLNARYNESGNFVGSPYMGEDAGYNGYGDTYDSNYFVSFSQMGTMEHMNEQYGFGGYPAPYRTPGPLWEDPDVYDGNGGGRGCKGHQQRRDICSGSTMNFGCNSKGRKGDVRDNNTFVPGDSYGPKDPMGGMEDSHYLGKNCHGGKNFGDYDPFTGNYMKGMHSTGKNPWPQGAKGRADIESARRRVPGAEFTGMHDIYGGVEDIPGCRWTEDRFGHEYGPSFGVQAEF